ncbi:MAG: PAS domain S-box protein [Acidobacteriota bacterium]
MGNVVERGLRGESGSRALRSDQLSAVLGIIERVSDAFDVATFFDFLADTIHAHGDGYAGVSILECSSGAARLLAGRGASPPAQALSCATACNAARGGDRCRICIAEDGDSGEGKDTDAAGRRAFICARIGEVGRAGIVLALESPRGVGFERQDLKVVELLSGYLAHILESIVREEHIREKGRKIKWIGEICGRILAATTIDDAPRRAVEAIVNEYGYGRACVALLTEDGRELIAAAHHAQAGVRVPAGWRQRVGEGIVGEAAALRRTICCNDTAGDRDHVAPVPGVRAELCIPLIAGEVLVGVLDIDALAPGAFDHGDIALLETLARQLALVIIKARYLERTERARDYLENLIANAGDGIIVIDRNRRITRWNRGMERILGYRAAEMRGCTYDDLTAPDSVTGDLIEKGLRGGMLEGVEDLFARRDGRPIHVSVSLSPIRGPGNEVEDVCLIVRDVTQQKRTEERFRAMQRQIFESEQKFLGMIEKANDAIFILDTGAGRVVQANARAEGMIRRNRSELIGTDFLALHPEQERANARDHFDRVLKSGECEALDLHVLCRGSGPIDVEVTPRILSYGGKNVVQWLCRDISDRRRAEKEKQRLQSQLLQSEKLSAIGQLISGVAHELNNPLTGVIGYSQLLVSQDCNEKVRRGLDRVYSEARRCHRIVQNLLTFARKHTPEKSFISINDVVESTIELRSYQLRVDNIRVEKNLAKDLPRTMGDFHQLLQVFVNILINAHQALKEGSERGVITVTTMCDGGLIKVLMGDNGPGMAPDVLKRIFDPFFTTKVTGQGTGLGLSICYGIIEEHEGRIYAASTAGQGTTFTIELPLQRPTKGHENGDQRAGARRRVLPRSDSQGASRPPTVSHGS